MVMVMVVVSGVVVLLVIAMAIDGVASAAAADPRNDGGVSVAPHYDYSGDDDAIDGAIIGAIDGACDGAGDDDDDAGNDVMMLLLMMTWNVTAEFMVSLCYDDIM